MQGSKDKPPSSDDLDAAQPLADVDLDSMRGGAWSLCLNDPAMRDLKPAAGTDTAPVAPQTDPSTSVGKSKLLHK